MSERVELRVDGRTVRLSSPDKQLVRGVTKRQLAAHWQLVGPLTVAAVPDRLVTTTRVPDGPDGEVFFQKQQPRGMPAWVLTATVPKRDGGSVAHVVLEDTAHLLALVQFGSVEIHVTGWDVRAPMQARELLLDLDPPPDAPTEAVRDALRWTLQLTEELGLPTTVKTTGSKGFHVHVPVDQVAQDLVSEVAGVLADELARRHPEQLTTAFSKVDRRGRVLVDWWRNSGQSTAIAPWSPRVRPDAPVARPLRPVEVTDQLDEIEPAGCFVADVPALLDAHGDPWASPPAPVGASVLRDAVAALG